VNFNIIFLDIWFLREVQQFFFFFFFFLPGVLATVSVVGNSVLDAVGDFGVCSGKAQCVLCFAECGCIIINLVQKCCVVFITVGAY
jgi:hypothetical protein